MTKRARGGRAVDFGEKVGLEGGVIARSPSANIVFRIGERKGLGGGKKCNCPFPPPLPPGTLGSCTNNNSINACATILSLFIRHIFFKNSMVICITISDIFSGHESASGCMPGAKNCELVNLFFDRPIRINHAFV